MLSDEEYWEQNYSKQIVSLMKKKAELEKQVKQLEKPDVNRMVGKKLSTTTSGCNCQRMLLVLVQDGEVKTHMPISPIPCHLKEVLNDKYYYSRSRRREGEAFYADDTNHPWDEDFDKKLEHIERHGRLVETLHINGRVYEKQICDYADEAIGEGFQYSFDKEFEELPNGIYRVLFEQACFSYSGPEGTEGDSESDMELQTSVPLWEYLKYKDELLEAWEHEGVELVDSYLYIQKLHQTQQKYEDKFVKDKDIQWLT